MGILPAEDEALLSEVAPFATHAVEPAVARPELPMAATTWTELLAEVESLGLAGADAEPSGLGPWELLDTDAHGSERAQTPGSTLALLSRLGRASAAVSLAVHQRSLARVVLRRAGLAGRIGAGPLAIAPQAHYGLGRTALAHALASAPLTPDDRALLADAYAADAARVLPLDPGFAGLVTPVFVADELTFQVHARADLEVTAYPNAHGLDELITAEVRPRASGFVSTLAPAEARVLFGQALMAHQLGLLAIAAGAVERVHELARRFAAQRRQGGAFIDQHPAVLGLLGRSRATLHTTFAQLDAASTRPLALGALPATLALRAQAQPALADAANAALQVFGGLGYMRDTGAEKVVRDVNCIRALAGSPRELLLIVAEWERLHA